MSPTINLSPQTANALRVVISAGFQVSLGQGGSSLSPEDLEALILEVQDNLVFPEQVLVGVPLWDLPRINYGATSDGSSLGGGDTVPFEMTTTYREVGRGKILADSFNEQGWIVVQALLVGTDSFGAPIDIWAALMSADVPPSGEGDDPATRGKTVADTTHIETDVPGVSLSATPMYIKFFGIFEAHGHASGVHFQTLEGHWKNCINGARAGDLPFLVGTIAPNQFDPTISKYLKLMFKATALSGTQSLKVLSSKGTFFHPRDGSGYEE